MAELKEILELMLKQREEDQAQRKQDLELMQEQLKELVNKLQPATPSSTSTVSTPSLSPFDSTMPRCHPRLSSLGEVASRHLLRHRL